MVHGVCNAVFAGTLAGIRTAACRRTCGEARVQRSQEPPDCVCHVPAESCQNSSVSFFDTSAKGTRFADMLQLEDLKRHSRSELHLEALREGPHSSRQSAESEKPQDGGTPTPAQIRLAVECCRRPRSGQTVEYEAKAKLASRADARNFPTARSTATEFSRIMQAMAAALRAEDCVLIKSVVAAALSEDAPCQDVSPYEVCLVGSPGRQQGLLGHARHAGRQRLPAACSMP